MYSADDTFSIHSLYRQSDKIFGGTYAVAPSTSEDVASTLNQQLLKKAREEETLNTDIDKEIAAYLARASMYTESALLFWNENMASLSSLPQLSCLARIYLCLSAESVPVECLFSRSGIILNGKRSSLAPHRCQSICFIHDNFHLL